jgi:hypothetical protein
LPGRREKLPSFTIEYNSDENRVSNQSPQNQVAFRFSSFSPVPVIPISTIAAPARGDWKIAKGEE